MEASSHDLSYLLLSIPSLYIVSQSVYLSVFFTCPPPQECETLGVETWSTAVTPCLPRTETRVWCSQSNIWRCPPFTRLFVIFFFSQDIVWHSGSTVDKNLNPVRKQTDLFGKMKQNIFLSSINIWWMLTRYFQNKKHIETAYVSGQMKL